MTLGRQFQDPFRQDPVLFFDFFTEEKCIPIVIRKTPIVSLFFKQYFYLLKSSNKSVLVSSYLRRQSNRPLLWTLTMYNRTPSSVILPMSVHPFLPSTDTPRQHRSLRLGPLPLYFRTTLHHSRVSLRSRNGKVDVSKPVKRCYTTMNVTMSS